MSRPGIRTSCLSLLLLFFLALAVRLGQDWYFFLLHGPQAAHLIEVWYYLGVAEGVESLSPLDPTGWFLVLLGELARGKSLYHLVVGGAAVLSSLAAVAISLWVGLDFDRRSGTWAGLAWVVLPAPLTLCLANFSHDLMQGPLLPLLFFCFLAVFAPSRRRWIWLLPAALLAGGSLAVGPLAFGALAALLLAALAEAVAFWSWRRWGYWIGWSLAAAGCGVFVVLFHYHWLEWLAPLAARFRGIDLVAQVKIGVGDLLPLPPNGLWNRYGLFLFLVPWGVWRSLRVRRPFPIILFAVALGLSLSVNRSARLLDLGIVALAGAALADPARRRAWLTAAFAAVVLGLNLLAPAAASSVRLEMPFREQLLGLPPRATPVLATWLSAWLALPWALSPIFLKDRWRPWAFLVPAALSCAWVLGAARTASDQVEYDLYRELDRVIPSGAKVFAAWNQGYMIRALTDLDPVATPENIDYGINRHYWEDEETAWQGLRSRGVEFIRISTRGFGVTWTDRAADRFGMRGNTIIGPPPAHITRLSDLERTLMFRLHYRPESLRLFRLIGSRLDPVHGIGVRVFELAKKKP